MGHSVSECLCWQSLCVSSVTLPLSTGYITLNHLNIGCILASSRKTVVKCTNFSWTLDKEILYRRRRKILNFAEKERYHTYDKRNIEKTLPKAQRTRGLSSYHRISIKHQFQNLNQTSSSRLNVKLKSWTNLHSEYWPRFNFLNLNQTSAAKYWQNFSLKISPELQLQNLDRSAQSLNKS